MSNNDLTTQFGGGDLSDQDVDMLVNQMMNAGSTMGGGAGVQYLKCSKGVWCVGRDNDTFNENFFMAVPNLQGASHGWQCWKDGQIEDEVFVSVAQPLPTKASLPDHGPYTNQNDGWSEAGRLELVILAENGVQTPMMASFTTSSAGGRRAIGDLMIAYGKALKTGQHTNNLPKVKCGADEYRHATYGIIKHPTFAIEDWVTMDEFQKLTAGAQSDNDAPAEPELSQGQEPADPGDSASEQAAENTDSADLDDIPF